MYTERFAAGAEMQYGFLGGALSQPVGSSSVRCENDRQIGYGLGAGLAVGGTSPLLLFAQAFETVDRST